ncbi:hypothetical protein HJC23_005766 [Cyclotella cryptica]|uniref:Uncharacterized protein n=1 Tax=Cyclotella cryptica TaxID=29204 RepID=A0ABD3NN90_9STRA
MAPHKSKAIGRSCSNPSSSSSSSHAESAMSSRQQEASEPALRVDDFSARRSARVSSGRYVADNDTWVEALAVCEMTNDSKKASNSVKGGTGLLKKLKSKSNTGSSETLHDGSNLQQQQDAEMVIAAQRLALRPYFQSQNTGQRVWDEPPSGASNIVYASSEARKMAQAQLEEMRATYAHAAVLRRSERDEPVSNKNLNEVDKTSGGRRLALPRLFKKTSKLSHETEGQPFSTALVASSNSVANAAVRSSAARTGIPMSILEESVNLASESSYEHDLQMAMMLSMGIGRGSVMGVGDCPSNINESDPYSFDFESPNNSTPAAAARREREQIAMAMALSLAEEKARRAPVENCRQSKSDQTTKTRATTSTNETTNAALSLLPKQSENLAPPPTMSQIESDFEISCNGLI